MQPRVYPVMHPRLHIVLSSAVAIVLFGGIYWGSRAWLGERTRSAQVLTYSLLLSTSPRRGAQSPVFEARQGDTVTFVVRSDMPGEVHVHGVEKKIVLQPGGVVKLTFRADRVGVFPVHL